MREIAGLLRTDAPSLRAVALVERLTGSSLSPLCGADVEPLREVLGRARYLLEE